MNIYKSNNWEVVFGTWCQEFPGYCIITTTKEKENLSELTNEEWQELGLIEKELERVIKKLFQATMFNFACLMNNAYRDCEKPHVHFHFIPRYEKKTKVLDKEYQDIHFGYNMWKWALDEENCQKDIFTKEQRIQIGKLVKEEFNKDSILN